MLQGRQKTAAGRRARWWVVRGPWRTPSPPPRTRTASGSDAEIPHLYIMKWEYMRPTPNVEKKSVIKDENTLRNDDDKGLFCAFNLPLGKHILFWTDNASRGQFPQIFHSLEWHVIINEERRLKYSAIIIVPWKHNHKVVRLSSRREWRRRKRTCYFYRRGVFYGLWKIMLFLAIFIINRYIRLSRRPNPMNEATLNSETPKYKALKFIYGVQGDPPVSLITSFRLHQE